MGRNFERALRAVAAEWKYEQEHGLGEWVWVGDTDHVERDYFERATHG